MTQDYEEQGYAVTVRVWPDRLVAMIKGPGRFHLADSPTATKEEGMSVLRQRVSEVIAADQVCRR